MSRIQKYLIIIAIIIISGVTNCFEYNPTGEMIKLTEYQQVTVTPTPLELHGDSVTFTISFKLPTKMMRKSHDYIAEIYYAPGDVNKMPKGKAPKTGEHLVDTFRFEGNVYSIAPEAPNVSKKMSFAYKDSFNKGYLKAYGIISRKQRNKRFGPLPITNKGKPVVGIITTSRLVETPRENEDAKNGVRAYEVIKSATSRDDGKYKIAYELLKNAPNTATNKFNQGLAYLLEGKNYEQAKKAFEEAAKLKQQYALSYYILAIVAARTNNTQELITNLKKAVELETKLKTKARKDAEFFRYWEQADFLKITE